MAALRRRQWSLTKICNPRHKQTDVNTSHHDLLLIGGDNATTWIVYNRLVREFGIFPCIIEEHLPRSTLLKNRARKLGWLPVLDQLAFVALLRPLLRYQAARRVREICRDNDLETRAPLTPAIARVDNINDPAAIARIKAFTPKIVIVNGTRILRPDVLKAVPAIFINTHQGITPQYRGSHGAYWALHKSDKENCGVTVHLVDQGIDTGNIIGQAMIEPTSADGFVTYPYLQTAAALPILSKAVSEARQGELATRAISGPSAVWYHPGVTQYLRAWLRGVR